MTDWNRYAICEALRHADFDSKYRDVIASENLITVFLAGGKFIRLQVVEADDE